MEFEKTEDINKIVTREIINKTIDISIDYSELCLDSFLKDGILKEISTISSIVGFYNIGNSLIDRYKVKKILTFFQEFHSKNIESDKLTRFKIKISQDLTYQNKIVETVILFNERFLQVEKSKILANLIIAHIEEKIGWDELQDILIALEIINPKGFDLLRKISLEINWANQQSYDYYQEALIVASGIGYRAGSRFYILPFGQKLFEYGIKPLAKKS
jgi:hypothetical protein